MLPWSIQEMMILGPSKTRAILLSIVLLFALTPTWLMAQQTDPGLAPQTSSLPATDARDAPEKTLTTEEAIRLEHRLTALEVNVANLRDNILVGTGTLIALVTLFGVARSVWNYFSGRQARKLQDDFLKSSADTVRLVNDTLRLAKEANERAAASVERRARLELEAIDTAVKDLLSEANRQGVREIVSRPNFRTALEGLAERINAFDIYRIILDEKISLTSHCHFLKGLAAHLKNHFDAALDHWRVVAQNDGAERDLRSQAFYWMGYEFNNLGQFGRAKHSFDEARKYSEGSRSFELERIAIESEFFDSDRADAAAKKITQLVDRIQKEPGGDDVLKVRDAVQITAGNINYALGRERAEQGNSTGAEEAFDRARGYFGSVSRPNPYSQLGLAQCCLQLHADEDGARKILRTTVLDAAQRDFVNRVERRTKALARFTELVCCLANPSLRKDASALQSQILAEIGDVDSRLTLYSLIRRRNVSKDEFQRDVAVALSEGTGA